MDIRSTLEFAEETGISAGTLLKELFGKNCSMEFKGDRNMVTEADRRSQELILESIGKKFPDHRVLAEEEHDCTNPSDLTGPTWIVDPLDGTTNFYHGFPVFAVSIALYDGETPILGTVYDPMRNELFSGAADRKSTLNGEPIQVSGREDLSESLILTGFPYDRKDPSRNNLANFSRMMHRCQGIRRAGSASLDLCNVAAGRADAFWELCLSPWDIAAGAIIIAGAGGRVSSLLRSQGPGGDCRAMAVKFSPMVPDIIADNGHLAHEMLTTIEC